MEPLLQEKVLRLVLLLRLAVVFHRSRRDDGLAEFAISVRSNQVNLKFAPGWIEQRPLLLADLQQEQDYWKKIDCTLEFE